MPKYTLHYFGVRNLAELSRLIFAQAEQEFTDYRIDMAKWPEVKKNSEFLFVRDDRITRFINKNYGERTYYLLRDVTYM